MSVGGHQGTSSYDSLLFWNLLLLFVALLFQLLELFLKMSHLLDQVLRLVILYLQILIHIRVVKRGAHIRGLVILVDV